MFKKVLYILIIFCLSSLSLKAQLDTTRNLQPDTTLSIQAIEGGAVIMLRPPIDPPPFVCVSSISPTSYNFGETGGSMNIQVTNVDGCNWSASENLTWISIQKSGNTLIVTCQSNLTTFPRSGSISIEEKSFQVSQEAGIPLPDPSLISQNQQCNVTYLTPVPPGGYEWWIQGSSCGTNKWVDNNNFPIYESGTYYVRAYDPIKDKWSTNCASFYVEVKGDPTITTSASPGSTIEMGQSTTLTASGASTYSWSPSSSLSSSTGSSVTASPVVPTTYTVIGTNSMGCTGSTTISIDVTVPVPDAPIQTYQCHSTLLTKGTPPSGVVWYWQGTSCGASTANSSDTLTVYNSDTYFLRAKRLSDGRRSPSCAAFYVEVKGEPAVSASASPNIIEQGQSSQLSASGASTYSWSPSTGLSATTGNPVTASPTLSTDYTVTGTASWGCSATSAVRLEVEIAANISRSQNNLTVNASGGNGTYSYLWSTGESTPTIEAPDDGNYSVTVTDGFGQTQNTGFNFVKTQDYNQNYIRTFVPFKDHQPQTVPDFNNLDHTQWKVGTSYFDGFGRSSQTVISKASPSGKDIVAFAQYDSLGRRSKNYLSYTANPVDMPGAYRTKVLTEQHGFYNEHFGQGDYAYAKTEFDGSPLNIPKKHYQHGQDWENEFSQFNYNSALGFSVTNWQVNDSNKLEKNGSYSSEKLIKVEVEDEDHRKSVVFKDLQGRQILRRDSLGDGTYALTYSAYDKFGRLRYVITPKAEAALTNSCYSSNDSIIKELCYYYEYNTRHLLVKKQLPGADYISLEYDNLDRVIKSQDAKQRLKEEKSFIEYDTLGRVHATGLENDRGTIQYLSYNYYDNYDEFSSDFNFDPGPDYHTKSNLTRGMPTGSKVRMVNWDSTEVREEWLYSVTYYDDFGRPIQTISNNHKGGIDVTIH